MGIGVCLRHRGRSGRPLAWQPVELDPPEIETDDPFDGISGPYVATFTGRIPFLLGIPDHLGHTVTFPHAFVDPAATKVFGPHPTINIRVFTNRTAGIPMRPLGAAPTLKRYYNHDASEGPAERFAENKLAEYEQWVTLETQGAIAQGEGPADKRLYVSPLFELLQSFPSGRDGRDAGLPSAYGRRSGL